SPVPSQPGPTRSESLFRRSRAGIRGCASPRAAGVCPRFSVGLMSFVVVRIGTCLPCLRRHSMRWRYRFFLPLLLLLLVAAPASAQYMFLDTNGDAAHTSADVLTTGSQTVNVYLDTNHNKDGSAATCDADGVSPLTINSYVFNFTGTNVTYSGFTNDMGSSF